MDDLCALVGWTRSVALVRWFGGSNLYVPAEPSASHPLATLLGLDVMRRVVDEFACQTVWIPADLGGRYANGDQAKQAVSRLILRGMGTRDIADRLDMSQRQVQRLRAELEAAGMLPMARAEKPEGKIPAKNAPEKRP